MQDSSNLEYLVLVVISIFCGLGVRVALGFAKQKWAMTYHHTMSYALLPPVTMVITTLISGNIALSLGMIGALSIVRFRNPVKNPFELVIFFALITIGIGVSVDVRLGILMTVVVMLVIFFAKIFEDISKKRGKSLFSLSFEEGATAHIIEVKSIKSIQSLNENKNLVQFFSSKEPESYSYRLVFSNKDEMNDLKKILEKDRDIESIEIRYVP